MASSNEDNGNVRASTKRSWPWEIRRNITIFSAAAIVWLGALFFYVWGQPPLQAFQCNDPALSLPYHESTVPSPVLYAVSIVVSLILICIVEYLHLRNQTHSALMGPLLWAVTPTFLAVLVGGGVTVVSTDIGKYVVGRPRPHFLSRCLPTCNTTVADVVDSTTGLLVQRNFVVGLDGNDPCTYAKEPSAKRNARAMKELRLSFPSGHSSFAAYSALFLCLYLHNVFDWARFVVVKLLLQTLFASGALYVCFSRVMDYKHRLSDVAAGALLGTVVAVFVASQLCHWWPVAAGRQQRRTAVYNRESPAQDLSADRESLLMTAKECRRAEID